MSEPARSRAEQHIEALMNELPPDSPRYRALASARDFKASWVSLGEQLQGVRHRKLFSEWGYASFEDYCQKEIHIRRQTALKLTNAYHFLVNREPELLQRRTEAENIPDYRAVDLLRQASEEAGFAAEDYDQLREVVIEQGRSLPTVRQQFNQVLRATEPEEDAVRRNLQAALAAARRLQNALQVLPEHAEICQAPLEALQRRLEQDLASDDTK